MAGLPVETSELATLLVSMERAVAETAAGFRRGMALVASLFFGMALIFGLSFGSWGVSAFTAAFGVGVVLLGRRASQRTSPERMRPVLEAMRDAPERIVLIRHYETSDSRRMFVSHWLEIRTGDTRLIMKVQGQWQNLLSIATRRCPGAKLVAR